MPYRPTPAGSPFRRSPHGTQEASREAAAQRQQEALERAERAAEAANAAKAELARRPGREDGWWR